MKSLVAYFSRAGYNWVNGEKKELQKGNTQILAEMIASICKGDLFSIEMETPYSYNYDTCCEQAHMDITNNNHPTLVDKELDLDSYDVIYLGFPIYWGTFPMAIFSFIEKYHLQNKIIYPFITHEGSGQASSISMLKKACSDSEIKKPFVAVGSFVSSYQKQLKEWMKQ